jgi:hypothetical protein
MRETRQSGSEGGARFKPSSLPLSKEDGQHGSGQFVLACDLFE